MEIPLNPIARIHTSDSTEHLRAALANISEGVITTDAHRNVTYLNHLAGTLTGWSHEQALGQPLDKVFNLIREDTRETLECPTVPVVRDTAIVGLAKHALLIGRDGSAVRIENSAAPIRNAVGNIAGAVLIFRDLTIPEENASGPRESNDQYHTLFNSIDSGFCIVEMLFDADGVASNYTLIEANPAFDRLTGLHNAVGKRIRDLLPDLESHWITSIGSVSTTGQPMRTVNQVAALGNRWFDVYAFRLGGGESRKVALLFNDITVRTTSEANLLRSEVRYRRLFQTAKDGILILDAETGKIIDANAYMSGLVGLEPADLMGKELYEIGMFRDIEENKAAFLELQRTGYLRHEHLPVQKKNGAEAEVEFIANVYLEGDRMVAQCNVRDISARVAMEKKIMQQAAALADESRRKDEFLAMLSHELRNPLAPIRSAVHLLKLHERGSENPIQRQAREVIERQVTNLTRLVSDLLEVSRVVSGRIRLKNQILDLNQVVKHAVESVRPLIDQRNHELTLKLCSDGVWVSADPTRMEEVFINLLTNAAKYTDEGGHIEVHCDHPHGQNFAEMRVRDNGVGIEKRLLPTIFDLFTQADRTLDRSQGGLGIGLNLAHRLVELHGGTIEAKSPPDGAHQGSEFFVRLPLMPAPQETVPERINARISHDGTGKRVLLVDDNIDMVTMLASVLRHKGYSVQSSYTGTDGVKVAHQWRPDIVLLDIGLPGLDGYEVARRLRADPGTKNARLIAMTGYGRESDIALAMEAGFNAHAVKPYDFDDLEKLMETPPPTDPKTVQPSSPRHKE